MKDFQDFAEAIRIRESSNNYECENEYRYLGAYQFGRPRLWDLGLSIDGWKPNWLKKIVKQTKHLILYGNKKYIQIISKQAFLNSEKIQDEIFKDHINDYYRYIHRKYPRYISIYSESGLIAGLHLKGYSGLRDFLKGKDNKDALGTYISSYIYQFADYDLTTEDIIIKG